MAPNLSKLGLLLILFCCPYFSRERSALGSRPLARAACHARLGLPHGEEQAQAKQNAVQFCPISYMLLKTAVAVGKQCSLPGKFWKDCRHARSGRRPLAAARWCVTCPTMFSIDETICVTCEL